MNCKICRQPISLFSVNTVLRKYEISYYRCDTCGFIQTQEPFWLEEAYSDTINSSDIGLIGRNLSQAELASAAISFFFDQREKYLDYGGGYGLFVRLMRDKGYNFYLYEPQCENLFAKTFDVQLTTNVSYNLLTAFEVFEHLVDPLAEIEQMLSLSQNIFFSTYLLPPSSPKPSEWWYYGLEHGQHVSIYSRESLSYLAKRLGMRVYSNGKSHHLLTNKKISHRLFSLLMRLKVARAVNVAFRRRSLLADDYFKIVGRRLV